jgi:hypothetical protein
MQSIQEIFNRLQERKSEQRQMRLLYKDALESSGEYRELLDKLEELKAKKKQLELEAWDTIGNKDKFDFIKLDINSDKELLNDIALSTLMKGETVKVVDRDNNEYEPKFNVSFKKTNVVSQQN